jgi:atypical dual specificity phosphatase
MSLRRRFVTFPLSPIISTPPLPEMLSVDTQPWQTSLIAAAQQRSGRRPSLRRGHSASEVLPRLYLTDLFTARDEAQLTYLGITHVVSVIEHAPILPETHSLRTLHIPLSDSSDQDILAHLPVAISFIHNALAEGPDSRVLVSIRWLNMPSLFSIQSPVFFQVHCLMGISRSATVVCAYLIATMRMTPDEALAAVKEKRGFVSPNMGFLRQLEEYAAQVQGGRGPGRGGARRAKAKLGENVAETIRRLTQKDPNSSPASMTGVSPSLALPSSKSSR